MLTPRLWTVLNYVSAFRAYPFQREEKVTLCIKEKSASPQVFLLHFKTMNRLLEVEVIRE